MKLFILPCLFLTSCATLFPPKTIEVKIPVAVSCIDVMPEKPDLISDAELWSYENGNFITALHVDRLQRKSYEALLEAVLEGCIAR